MASVCVVALSRLYTAMQQKCALKATPNFRQALSLDGKLQHWLSCSIAHAVWACSAV
jgi:hypothetical protein